jgi:hypothetical protein
VREEEMYTGLKRWADIDENLIMKDHLVAKYNPDWTIAYDAGVAMLLPARKKPLVCFGSSCRIITIINIITIVVIIDIACFQSNN